MTATSKKMHKVEVIAPLNTELAALSTVADALAIPAEGDRQPDLQYLTAIFVSSGMNKNGAVFLGSELVKARGSIVDKAVDIEHDEQRLIGQITNRVFLKRDRTVIDAERAESAMSMEDLDATDMDIGISAIIHKARFPDISEEIMEGQWMVSMEAYYRDFDVKVGDNIIPREQAEALGYDKMVGTVVQVRDGNKELGFHLVGRVLRDILFAGVGIVRNPANPRSIIMEAAALNQYVSEEASQGSVSQINLADVTSIERRTLPKDSISVQTLTANEDLRDVLKTAVIEAVNEALGKKEELPNKEEADSFFNHNLPGTCLHYKKRLINKKGPEDDDLPEPAEDFTQYPQSQHPNPSDGLAPGDEIAREHYCNLFDLDCSSRPGDATAPECWRNVFARTVRDEIVSHEDMLRRKRIAEGLVSLEALLNDARKFTS